MGRAAPSARAACRVPRGKYIFFSLINYVVALTAYQPTSCPPIVSTAARMTDGASMLVVQLDGQKITDLGARTPNKVRIYPAAANGYYVMLKPLPPGKHALEFGGALPSMLQAVSYTLLVE